MSPDIPGAESVKVDKVAQGMVSAYRELTVAAVVLGVIQGVVLNLAFVYAALKLGFSIGGSTVASIMGYTLLRGVMRVGTMAENNINQTIASGINTAGTGVVFTIPALFLLPELTGSESGADFQMLPLALGGIAGALLGSMVIVPLRKQMIEMDRLRFPSGIATTTIIRAGSAGTEKAILLGVGFAISAVWKIVMDSGALDTPGWVEKFGFGITHEELHFGFNLIPDYFAPVVYLSLMNLAAGMLAGRGGLPFFAGGALSWWIISPMSVGMGWTSAAPEGGVDGFIYGNMLRPLGIGVLIGGALMGVVTSLPAIRSAFRSLAQASTTSGGGGRREELSIPALLSVTGVGMLLFFIASIITPDITIAQACMTTTIGTLWLSLAALIVAQATGLTDISPMSGMSLISVTLMLILLNGNVAGAMVVGVAVCVAIGQAADMMQDLKTGHMIGAVPIKQQLVQVASTWLGALVALGAIYLLWISGEGGSGGFGPNTALPAPQGGALAGVIGSIQSGQVPIDKYAAGAVVGGLLGAAPLPGLGVLIGLAMYLPFSITLGYGMGCFLQMGIQRIFGRSFCDNRLVPFAAGLIVGEALMGIGGAAFSILFPEGLF